MIGKLVVVALAFLSACKAAAVPETNIDGFFARIIGGHNAYIGDYPWQASLRRYNGHICGAVILSNYWVLTAAHCVSSTSPSSLSIRVGVTEKSDASGQTVGVSVIYPHERYNSNSLVNDIALLRLSGGLDLTNRIARAIPIPPYNAEEVTGSICTITGWGYTLEGAQGSPETLQAATSMRVLSTSECSGRWPSVGTTHICVDNNYQGACNGDSGGPLTCVKGGQSYIYGVTSFGVQGCYTYGNPTVYTRVTAYRDWIYGISGIA